MKKKMFSLLVVCFILMTGFNYQTITTLNVREQPNSNSKKITTLNANTPLTIMSIENGWGKINYNGVIVYVSAKYVKPYEQIESLHLKFESPINLSVIGDSITWGYQYNGTRSIAYPEYLGIKAGASVVNNYGSCATTVAINNPNSFTLRYSTMDVKSNLIIVLGGTNDYEFCTPLGTSADTDPHSFYGALNTIMNGLKKNYPGKYIVFMTPIKRLSGENPNKIGLPLTAYVDAIKVAGMQNGIYVLDLYSPVELDFTKKYQELMPDGLHPTAQGQEQIATYIFKRLF